MARTWRVIAIGALLQASCDGGAAPPQLRIELPSGPPAYRVVVAGETGVDAFSCPLAAESSAWRCTPDGFELYRAEPGTEITIKAPQHAFSRLLVDPPMLEAQTLVVELARLAPFEATASYATGFHAEDGEAEFEQLAIETSGDLGTTFVVKFYIELAEPPRVYFQNTRSFPRHFEFARDVLGAAVSAASFAQDTYTGEDRRALAGTLSFLPELTFPTRDSEQDAATPVILEFFPGDDLTPNQALHVHQLLEERMLWLELEGTARRLVYVPAGSLQETALLDHAERFSRRDAPFSTRVDVYSGLDRQLLNPGVAYGTLRATSAEELERSVVSFRDVLVLERLPNDLPLVAGTITEELQTPLSHVNLAAQARGTPNMSLLGARTNPRVAPYLDKLVRLEVGPGAFSLTEVSRAEAEAFWQAERPAPITPTSDLALSGLPSLAELGFADSSRVGSKAANVAELRRLLGDQAPDGFAVPFSAYDAYVGSNRVTAALCEGAQADCELERRSMEVCQLARTRCVASADAGDTFSVFIRGLLADPEFLNDTELREAISNTVVFALASGSVDPSFAAALDARAAEIFSMQQIRLRSSSNVEDLSGFKGAGLYTSVSAEGAGERRPSARIRDVWASAWSFRALEERAFWNVDQSRVLMGVLVNAAVDDEVVNGVLITRDLQNPGAPGVYVNVQAGEVEVANPENGAIPEVFSIVPAPGGAVQVMRQRYSSLSPGAALLTDAEIHELWSAADRVQLHFAELYGIPPNTLALDLEFELIGRERRLQIKQVRPY